MFRNFLFLVLWTLILSGPVCFSNEHLATRAEVAERRITSQPKDWNAWSDLVEARLAMGDLLRAGAALEKWRNQKPSVTGKFPVIDFLEGRLAQEQRQLDAAVSCWMRALEKGADKTALLPKIANLRMQQERWTEAVDALSEVLRVLPLKGASKKPVERELGIRVECLMMRAGCRVRMKNWLLAREHVYEANELNPGSAAVKRWFPLFESSDAWLGELERLDRAVADASTEEDRVNRLLERCLFFVGKSLVIPAFEDAVQAHKLAPGLLRARFWKGMCAHLAKKAEQVGRVQALDALKDPDQQAESLMHLQQPYFASVVTESSDGSIARASALRALGEMVPARRAAQRAVEKHPDSPRALLVWAEFEFENGNLEQTLALTSRILAMPDATFHAAATRLQTQAAASRGTR
jgi:tetratricopeptide (TPR) repeat protein